MQHCESYDVKRETCYQRNVDSVARDQSVQIMRRPDVVAGISVPFEKLAFVLFCCYIT